MARITEQFIKFGTGSREVNSRSLPANYTPSSYTPAQVGSEGTDKVSAHLKGINTALASVGVGPAGDIGETSFSAANNQSAAANVTGFSFSNSVVRSFSAHVSVFRDATSDLYESINILGVQKGSDWDISISRVGDDSGIEFTITTSGQIQYTSTNLAGHVASTIKFRAETTSI